MAWINIHLSEWYVARRLISDAESLWQFISRLIQNDITRDVSGLKEGRMRGERGSERGSE